MDPKFITICDNLYSLIEDIENDGIDDDSFQINQYINEQNYKEKRQFITIILKLLAKIVKNHHRPINFFEKIEKIIKNMQDTIKQMFSNYQIFLIFKGNKRILLFLIKEKVLFLDKSIVNIITNDKYSKKMYPQYLYFEIKPYISQKMQIEIDQKNQKLIEEAESDFSLFEQKRLIGENDNYICELIRNDEIEKFCSYVTKNNYPLASKIPISVFETNSFILKKEPTLIEYAAFFGSIQIFQYLEFNEVSLKPSLWIYTIHGKNYDLIHHLEERRITPKDTSYKKCTIESIKCHHNDLYQYFINLYNLEEDENVISNSIKYFNFPCFPKNLTNISVFYDFCTYNYVQFVENLLENPDIILNINQICVRDNESNKTALLAAIEKGNYHIVQLLLATKKIDINIKSILIIRDPNKILEKHEKTALCIAIENGNVEIIKLLLSEKNLNINDKSISFYDENESSEKSALHKAIENGDAEIVKLILQYQNINVNQKAIISENNNHGYVKNDEKTPLHLAIEKGNVVIVKYLLGCQNIDVNLKSTDSEIFSNIRTKHGIFLLFLFIIFL